MNALEAYEPDDIGDSDPADAIAGIGAYGIIGRAAPNSTHTFGNGVLIAPNMLLCARHSFDGTGPNGTIWPAGYLELTPGQPTSRVARFRRNEDGSLGSAAGGNDSYKLVNITGILTPSPAEDICIAYLAESIDYITPLPLSNTLANSDALIIGGHGLEGSTLGAGSQSGDVLLIDVTAQAVVEGLSAFGWPVSPFTANLYDSGGAVIKVIGDEWHLVGVIYYVAAATNVAAFEHNPSFQLPNFYSPSPDPDPPEEWTMPTNSIFPTFSGYYTWGVEEVSNFAGLIIDVFHLEGMGGDYDGVGILSFDTSVYTPTAIAAFLTQHTLNSATQIRVRRIRRLVTDQATAFVYDGENAWSATGGLNTTNDVYTTNQFTFDPDDGANTLDGDALANLEAMYAAAKALGRDLQLHLQCLDTGGNFETIFAGGNAVDQGTRPYLSVTTETPPTVTSRLNVIAYNEATVETTVSGESITARGVCWSTSANPTTSDSKTTDGTGDGAIVSRMTPLNASTLYYARAYATNAGGTTYSAQMTFTTPPNFDAQFDPRGAFQSGRQGMQPSVQRRR